MIYIFFQSKSKQGWRWILIDLCYKWKYAVNIDLDLSLQSKSKQSLRQIYNLDWSVLSENGFRWSVLSQSLRFRSSFEIYVVRCGKDHPVLDLFFLLELLSCQFFFSFLRCCLTVLDFGFLYWNLVI